MPTAPTTFIYHTPAGVGETLPPNGSTAGRNALIAEETAGPGGTPRGCYDAARSSAGPRGLGAGKDTASMEYYAFAISAMSWASASLNAPASISQGDLIKIYNCTFTDWSQLPGGGEGPITRYIPQAGSGTRSFFLSDLLLGFDPTTVSSATPPPGSPYPCPAVNQALEENSANALPAADHDSAILAYDAGLWGFQANNKVNPTIDLRNGVRIGGQITPGGTNANESRWNTTDVAYELNQGTLASTPVNEDNVKVNNPAPDYIGIRYLYNVTDTVSPDYAAANALLGFNNVGGGTKSPLCSGTKKTTILSYGIGSLPASINPGGTHNLAGSTCRKYTN